MKKGEYGKQFDWIVIAATGCFFLRPSISRRMYRNHVSAIFFYSLFTSLLEPNRFQKKLLWYECYLGGAAIVGLVLYF